MIDIAEISTHLVLLDSGIWSSERRQEVSYPADGNAVCFGIEENSFWYKHRNECIAAIVERYPPKGAIFDIGGGNGIVAVKLKGLGIEVCVVEPGLSGALNSLERGVNTVVCSSLEASGFKANSIPAVGIFDVLEHIENDVAYLEKLKRVLVSDGRLYISVPAYSILWSHNDVRVGHFRRYRLGALCKTLANLGFSVDYSTYIFAALPIPVFLYRTLPSALRLSGRDITPATKRREHFVGCRRLRSVFGRILRRELVHVKRGGTIPIGSTCLVVATKP